MSAGVAASLRTLLTACPRGLPLALCAVLVAGCGSTTKRSVYYEDDGPPDRLDPAAFDLILLASATRNWNGAEIEQAVMSARITGHAKGTNVSQNDMLAAFGKIIPLSRTMEDQLKAIRSWARNRALPATTVTKPEM